MFGFQQETLDFKVLVSNSEWLSMPCGQFTSVELLPFGELNVRLALTPISVSWKDDMPGVF